MKAVSSFLDSNFRDYFTIQEVGIKLSPDDYSRIRAKMSSLELKAPAMSTIYLRFLSDQNEIKVSLLIEGGSGIFKAEANGLNPWELYQKVESEILLQLDSWKNSRFTDSSLNFISPSFNHSTNGGYSK